MADISFILTGYYGNIIVVLEQLLQMTCNISSEKLLSRSESRKK